MIDHMCIEGVNDTVDQIVIVHGTITSLKGNLLVFHLIRKYCPYVLEQC